MASLSTIIEASHLHTRLESTTVPILLRTIELKDAARFSAILSDPANDTDPHAKKIDAATAESIITKQRESAAKPTVLSSADDKVLSGPGRVNMVVEHNGEVIGLGGYGAIKDLVRDGENIRAGDVGAMIDPAHRGRGYATEAIRLAIDWAFTSVREGGPQLDLVTITTGEDNHAMIQLADEKLGLKGKGTRRNSPEQGAEDAIEVYYELTKQDWQTASHYRK